MGATAKLGPREKGRKQKGRRKPAAVKQAKARRKALLRQLAASAA